MGNSGTKCWRVRLAQPGSKTGSGASSSWAESLTQEGTPPGQRSRGLAGQKLWVEERTQVASVSRGQLHSRGRAISTPGACRHIPGPLQGFTARPILICCCQGHAAVAPVPETLSGPRVLVHSVGVAQAQGVTSAHLASQVLTCVPCPPPSHLSPLVLGLCKGANDSSERKGPTRAHRALSRGRGTGTRAMRDWLSSAEICTSPTGSLP